MRQRKAAANAGGDFVFARLQRRTERRLIVEVTRRIGKLREGIERFLLRFYLRVERKSARREQGADLLFGGCLHK